MKKNILFIILFSIFMVASSVNALEPEQHDEEIKKMLNKYAEAVKSKSSRRTEKAYTAIKDDPQALKYIKRNYPRYYHSLKMYELSLRAKNIAFEMEEVEAVPSVSTGSSSSRLITNAQQVSRYPIQNEPTNQDIVNSAPNQNLPDNRTIVNGDRNQDRLSNQELLKIRQKNPNR